MAIRRYFEILQLDDTGTIQVYERETGLKFSNLKYEMLKRYQVGYLRRKTDGPYFLRRCMNQDLIEANSHFRVG